MSALTISFDQRRVLVLNRTWTAVNITTLARAIRLLFATYKNGEPKAKIIDPSQDFMTFTWEDWSRLRPKNDEDIIQAGNMSFKIPEVILLAKYNKLPLQRSHFSRRAMYRRDNFTCQYCGARPGSEELTIDHVIPRAQGGKTTWDNCVLACVPCNSKKGNRTPKEAQMVLKKEPVKPTNLLFRASRKTSPKSWEHFLSEVYWSTELEE